MRFTFSKNSALYHFLEIERLTERKTGGHKKIDENNQWLIGTQDKIDDPREKMERSIQGIQ